MMEFLSSALVHRSVYSHTYIYFHTKETICMVIESRVYISSSWPMCTRGGPIALVY